MTADELPNERKTFEITFEHWKSESGENVCNFCEREQTRWYTDALGFGFCEKCFVEETKTKNSSDSFWDLREIKYTEAELAERLTKIHLAIHTHYYFTHENSFNALIELDKLIKELTRDK